MKSKGSIQEAARTDTAKMNSTINTTELPEQWLEVEFNELVENHDRTRIPLKQEDRDSRDGIFPYYGASGIIDQIDDFLFDGSFLLIAEDGANLLARSTPIAFQAHGKFWVNNHAHVVKALDGISQEYLEFYFNSLNLRQYVTGSAQPKLTQKNLSGIPIPIAPLEEQTRIVKKIESLQARSAKTRALLAELKPLIAQLRQSVLRSAFNGSLTADWRAKQHEAESNGSTQSGDAKHETASQLLQRIRVERRERWEAVQLAAFEAKGKEPSKGWRGKYKEPEPVDESEHPKLPDDWCYRRVDQVSTIIDSLHQTPSYSSEGIPMVRVTEIKGGILDLTAARLVTNEIFSEFSKRYLPRRGDIVFARVGSFGNVSYVDSDDLFCLGQNTAIITSEIDSRYLHYTLQSPNVKIQIDKTAIGTSQKSISLKSISALAAPIPSLKEQREIVVRLNMAMAYISKLDINITTIESSLTQLDQSILSKAFRGELVPQDPHDEPASDLLARIRAALEATAAKKKKATSKNKV